jgi:PAS domain S-box-containing protein
MHRPRRRFDLEVEMGRTTEIKRLQSCINDLISVLALPAIWTGRESSHIIGTLLDVLLTMLRLDFAYARLSDSIDASAIDVVRLAQRQLPSAEQQEVGRALGRWLSGDQTASRFVIPNPTGEGEVAIASFSLGLQDEVSVLVAGSRRADFPTDVELLLLRVAANQAAIGLQEARRSSDQKRVAEALERRVAERTSQLTATNEELRRSQAYLAEAQRLSHTGSFGWSVQSGEIRWSDETFRIFECDPQRKPTLEVVLQRTHPEDIAFVKQTIGRASQERRDFDFEHRLLMQDGSIKYVRVVGHAVKDESDEVEFVGALMDITSSKEAEDRTRLIIDTVPAQLWTESPEGVVDFVNRRWVDYTGMTLEEAVGSGWTGMVHPDDIERVLSKWRTLISEGKPREIESRLRRSDGAYRWFLSRCYPLVDRAGHILGWYGSDTDIHDRKEAEEKLRQSETYLAEAQRLTKTGSWASRIGEIRYLSEECYRVLGFDPNGGQPRYETFFQRIHPDDQAKFKEAVETAERDKSDFELDYRFVPPSGELRDIHVIGHPALSASGDLVEFVGTVMDVTERKRAEQGRERLRQAQADLAHVNRVATMGELTASVAHEVNQPIAAAVTNAKTCLRWLTRDHPDVEEARAAAMRIVNDGTRAAEIIKRVRLLFKKETSERELVDINEVVEEMVVLLRGEAMRYSIFLKTELEANTPRVMADRVQLQQVLMNLMLNGMDAMKDANGTRELIIKSQRGENDQALVSVNDTGVGLPPGQADRIFTAFFTTKPHGTGMGLSISRSIVESHGGRLWAANNSPRGASFCFSLPAKAEAPE